MNNIHILPTDKPSRLYQTRTNPLILDSKFENGKTNRHIYITNDEEIKDYYWYINSEGKLLQFTGRNVLGDKFKAPKVILTTDPQLIADGVQAIDDEFLEWFCKNSSCESVKVERLDTFKKTNEVYVDEIAGGNYYEIIKQYKIIISQEEPKQETLEEALNKLKEKHTVLNLYPSNMLKNVAEFGAKWQQEQDNKELAMWKLAVEKQEARCTALRSVISNLQERMYSEEEVLNILQDFANEDFSNVINIEEWFKQFKKK
jgi:hypothetical protein